MLLLLANLLRLAMFVDVDPFGFCFVILCSSDRFACLARRDVCCI